MFVGLPFSITLLAIIYFLLTRVLFRNESIKFKSSSELISNKLNELGKLNKNEKHVLTIFGITVFLWIFRTLINNLIPGFKLSDTIISVGCAISLFAIPIKFSKPQFILNWNDTKNLAWGILILFGGGLALAKGMSETGIVSLITDSIAGANLNILITVSLLITMMLFMTELMSNVALVAVLAPVMAGIAIGLEIPILHLLIPITMASSCAFMLPMATPPNAIVFASGYVKVSEMVRAGILINILSILLLILMYKFFIPMIFN